MRINVHAGHNPDGRTACGAVGILKESTEARLVKGEVLRKLQLLGYDVQDCTVEDGKNASDVLKKIVQKCNTHPADLDVSIHFNAGRKDLQGDGSTGGVEVYVYSKESEAVSYAKRIADAIAGLGYNKRSDSTSPVSGVKIKSGLYVLKNTSEPALLVECCFIDDKDDVERYDYRSMAEAIVYGITGQHAKEPEEDGSGEELTPEEGAVSGQAGRLYRVQTGAYSIRENAEKLAHELREAGYEAIIVS